MFWVGKIQEAIDHIERNLFGPLSAESVGRAIHYAPSSFSNYFSALTGYSVGEYIRFRRLSVAAEKLERGDTTVTDLAFTCGFETAEAFSKAFRRLLGCAPSQYASADTRHATFSPIGIQFMLKGGFGMTRNLIPGLQKVDWSDNQRQNEFVNSVVSALNALGENLTYDTVCAVSGCALRTSFSMPQSQAWNHGNYHVINAPAIIGHTFRMLGYAVTHHVRGDFETDSRLIIDSIDRGVPVITLEGVINCSDACVISGYDLGGKVLLGYNPFMDVEDDHDEAPDDTGYFRKTDWREGYSADWNQLRILIIGEKTEKPDAGAVFAETKKLAARLICEEPLCHGQYNGLSAHKAFADALMTYTWEDNFEPYLNLMCNYKQYLDRQYAVPFFRANGREDLARCYDRIAALARRLAQIVPQDFSAGEMFGDKRKLKPYADTLMEIRDAEREALGLLKA